MAPPAQARTSTLLVPSRLFGPLCLSADSSLRFPDGLLGFAGERKFVLLSASQEGVFWLHSVDDGSLVFLLIDPFHFFAGYEADLPDVGPETADGVAVFAIVTLPREEGDFCTANLQGPIVLDFHARTGRQAILQSTTYSTKHALDLGARSHGKA